MMAGSCVGRELMTNRMAHVAGWVQAHAGNFVTHNCLYDGDCRQMDVSYRVLGGDWSHSFYLAADDTGHHVCSGGETGASHEDVAAVLGRRMNFLVIRRLFACSKHLHSVKIEVIVKQSLHTSRLKASSAISVNMWSASSCSVMC